MNKLNSYFTFVSCAVLVFSLQSTELHCQTISEIDEFKTSIEQNLDIDELSKNPVLEAKQSDSILNSIDQNGDELFEAKFYHLLGKLNAEKGNFSVALEYYNTAEEYRTDSAFSDFFIHNLLDRGNLYFKNKDLAAAEKDYQSALSLGNNMGLEPSMAIAFNNLGLIELNRKNFEIANGLFYDALGIRQKLKDHFLIAHSYTYIAMLQFHKEQFDSAIVYYNKAKEELGKVGLDAENQRYCGQITRIYNELGFCYFKSGQSKSAQLYADSAIHCASRIESNYDRVSLLYQAARIHFFIGNLSRALEIGFKINAVADEYRFKDVLQKNYDLISDSYEQSKNFEKAIEYARKSHQMKDQLVNDRMTKKLADERLSYQVLANRKLLKMAERESELKSQELKAQRSITILLGIIGLIAILTAISLFYSNRQKMKVNQKLIETNQLIEKQNDEIKKQQELLSRANTELKKNFAELEEMGDEKSHLLSIVAHDLRTPLNSILGLCDLLELEDKDNNQENPERTKYLELIKESGGRMLNMINTLLNARKIESQQLDVKIENIEISPLMKNILEDHRLWSNRKSIKIFDELENGIRVKADKYLFQQVLENLITNAIKYSPINSQVRVVSEKRGQNYVIKVIDQGPGISREDQRRLFTKYQRLSAQPTAGEDSIGIGLSLVKKLIELMNGSVSCTSELGVGSTFEITIPEAA